MLTRIAPTPSGYLHLGNILSFSLTAALAEKAGARILLRIDDMDRERVNPLYIQDIFDTLNFLEIPWHEGPRNAAEFEQYWSQRYRLTLYQQTLQQLVQEDKVFACTCSRAQIRQTGNDENYPGTCAQRQLSLDAPGTSWRLNTNDQQPLTVFKWPAGEIRVPLPAQMQYFVIKKKDGFPAYQLTSLVDDLHFNVDLIVRGEDLWPSTLAQHYLARKLGAAGFEQIHFVHHPLLAGKGGIKLSKSAGDTSIKYLRGQGNKPDAVFKLIGQMLALPQPVTNWQQLAAALLGR